MDVSAVTQLVGSLGFPIVACGVLAYLFYREQENHKEETNRFTSAINELTIALTKLSNSLEGSGKNEP